jgi:Flp pilus assembly protein TadG
MFQASPSLRGLAARFRRGSNGTIAPTFAVAMVPILALIGTAVDFSRANNVRSTMQAALDAAVLAGARDDTANWAQTASNVFTGTFQAKGSSGAAPTFVLNGDGSFSGSVSASLPTDFLGTFGISAVTVNAQSTAMVAPTSPQSEYCLLALNLSAGPAVQISGNGDITISAPSCVMQVNSNSSDAVDLSGNATVATTDNCLVGGLHTSGNSSMSPHPDAVCKTLPDPFVNYPRPIVGACNYTNYSLSGNQTKTLSPGVYCGGMSFSANVNVTFSPGLYIVKDGIVQESGGSSFTGNGVTFFLTGKGAGIQMSGNANWHLVAPTSGSLAGFVIFLDPNGASGAPAASSQLSGNSELYFEGVVYLPKQQVTITGNAESFAPSPWTSFVADTLVIAGNGKLVINNNTSLTNVPIPAGLKMRTGGRLWLMQ